MNMKLIWQRLMEHESEEFCTIRKLPFTYMIKDEMLYNEKIKFSLSKANFEKAISEWPVNGPGSFGKDIMGTSYVFGILSDKRIIY